MKREELFLKALGFEEPSMNEANPDCWFNKQFPAVEVKFDSNKWTCTGPNSTNVRTGEFSEDPHQQAYQLHELGVSISDQLSDVFFILSDEELRL